MLSKTLIFVCLVIACGYALEHKIEEYYAYPKYEFKYGVEDKHTKDKKDREEKRDGHKVEQKYEWEEKDRKVQVKKWDGDGKFVKFEIELPKH